MGSLMHLGKTASHVAVVALAVSVGAMPAAAETKYSSVAFGGVDGGPSFDVVYAGAITALNGDITRDGVLLRALAGYAWYDYVGGVGHVDGRATVADLMIGYQQVMGNMRVAGFIGLDYQDHRLSPNDPFNHVNGTETGVKVVGDVSSLVGNPLFFNLLGSLSTAFDSYSARLRIGYNFGGSLVIGPEGWVFGNSFGDFQRVGVFLQMDTPIAGLPTRFTISGGHETRENRDALDGPNGFYGSLNIAVVF
jgi:cellulose biosynthesis protein BcsS